MVGNIITMQAKKRQWLGTSYSRVTRSSYWNAIGCTVGYFLSCCFNLMHVFLCGQLLTFTTVITKNKDKP
jgi:uncharacterized membrane protein YhaH (DUF805 family)